MMAINEPVDSRNQQIEFAQHYLGPIFYEFCARLYNYLENIDSKLLNDSVVLYVARGGLRIRYLYEMYLYVNKYSNSIAAQDFYCSRLGIAKGCLANNFDYIAPIIIKEYRYSKIPTLLTCIIKNLDNIPDEWNELETNIENFQKIYFDNNQVSQRIREYFWQQSHLLHKYIQRIAPKKTNIYLVDSGWYGSTQAMLMRQFPTILWTGLYFGKWDYHKTNASHLSRIIGLSADDSNLKHSPNRHCIFQYHHLIEDPLQINFPSTEEYTVDQNNQPVPTTGIAVDKEIAPSENDSHFLGIIQYFKNNFCINQEQIFEKAEQSYHELNNFIRFPKRQQITMMNVRDRSIDFGKTGDVPILRKVPETINFSRSSFRKKKQRISQSLWKQGQIALEFPPLIAWLLQKFIKLKPSV